MIALFREMPLTSKFGVIVILINVFVAVCAQWIAPYGETALVTIRVGAAQRRTSGWVATSWGATC